MSVAPATSNARQASLPLPCSAAQRMPGARAARARLIAWAIRASVSRRVTPAAGGAGDLSSSGHDAQAVPRPALAGPGARPVRHRVVRVDGGVGLSRLAHLLHGD